MIRYLSSGLVFAGLMTAALSQEPAAETPVAPATSVDANDESSSADATAKAPSLDPAEVKSASSYFLGYRTGGTFVQQFGRFGIGADDLDMENFLKGFTGALQSKQPEVSEETIQAAMEALGEMIEAREKKLAETNLQEGKKFLEENAQREEVITTESGLQYEILEKGTDEKYEEPKEGAPEKQFMVNYRGMLIDGTQFDASPEGQPFPMTLQVVEGFKEALTTMPVGAKWKLYIPSELAYGEERRSPDIGPNTTLIFELELVEIKDAPAAQGMPFPMPTPAE